MRLLVWSTCLALTACGGSNADFSEEPDTGVVDSASVDDASVDTGAADTSAAEATPGEVSTGCAAPRITCGGACVDPTNDPNNCGACGNACTELGLSCVASACKCTGSMCGGRCVNTRTDANNCGSCGKAVCHGEVCVDGKAQCAPGFKACSTTGPGCLGCVEITNDPNNCGDCGKSCGSTACSKGTCLKDTTCPTGLTYCSTFIFAGGCADLTRDLYNCGACGKQCGPGEICTGSKCTPYAGAVGCTTCPCANCKGTMPQCCNYAKTIICSTACPAG